MTSLQAYINQKNKWNAIFKGEQFELETAKGRQRVAQSLDADLSPENLSHVHETCGARPKSRLVFDTLGTLHTRRRAGLPGSSQAMSGAIGRAMYCWHNTGYSCKRS